MKMFSLNPSKESANTFTLNTALAGFNAEYEASIYGPTTIKRGDNFSLWSLLKEAVKPKQ
jgi:hypothetical protein